MKIIVFIFLALFGWGGVSAQNIGGIGAQLFLDTAGGHTMPRIQGLVANTPADSFLKATDFIITVNGVSCKDKTIEDVVALIRGEVGTKVHIVVADTKDGKRQREYDLIRKGIQVQGGQAAASPVEAFNVWAENEAAQLRAKGYTIVKTFNSACGNRYFNFDAEARTYSVRVISLLTNDAGTAFNTTMRVFDNDDETGATAINKTNTRRIGSGIVMETEGDATFKKNCIGVVNVQANGDVNKCQGMYVIVYR